MSHTSPLTFSPLYFNSEDNFDQEQKQNNQQEHYSYIMVILGLLYYNTALGTRDCHLLVIPHN